MEQVAVERPLHGKPRYVGVGIPRLEDRRFITGTGSYLDDIKLPRMLYAAVLRSPVAHAKLKSVDCKQAMAFPGVIAVKTIRELAQTLASEFPLHQGAPKGVRVPSFTGEKVRYVGDPIAALAAENRYAAEDALERIDVNFDPLPLVAGSEEALRQDGPIVNEELGDNIAHHFTFRSGDVESNLKKSDLVLTETFRIQRISACPIETRGLIADYDQMNGFLTVYWSTQVPHLNRTDLSELLGMPETKIRVIAPDVGGSFGAKLHVLPDELLVILLAIHTSRPVKWVETRLEHLQTVGHDREQIHKVEVGVRKGGKILAFRDKIVADIGAYPHALTLAPPLVTVFAMPGPYKVKDFEAELFLVYTNKGPLGAYRGFGQPQAYYVMERLVDIIAERLGIDPVDVRLANMIQPGDQPYRSVTGYHYDSGDYPDCLKRGLELVDYHGLRAKQRELRKDGRYMGIGLAFFIEGAGWAPSLILPSWGSDLPGYASATVRLDPSGKATVLTDVPSQGQGQETTLAQICAEILTLDIADIYIVAGDTNVTPYGTGTFASRSAAVAGSAVAMASTVVREKILRIAGHMHKTDLAELALDEGRVFLKTSPSRSLKISEIARNAFRGHNLPENTQPGLEATYFYDPSNMTFPFGLSVAIVEVDVETGEVKVPRFFMLHDCGKMLNPHVVEGQLQGAIVQGFGSVLTEHMVYDGACQNQTSTLMDYVIPSSVEVPSIELEHTVTLPPHVPIGAKGVGEGGAIPSPAAIANAVADALQPFKVKLNELPLTSDKIHRHLRATTMKPLESNIPSQLR